MPEPRGHRSGPPQGTKARSCGVLVVQGTQGTVGPNSYREIEHRSERSAGNTSTTTGPSTAAANGAGEPSSLLGCRPAQRCDSAIAPERTRRGCAYILELEQADWTQIGLADDRQPPATATVWRWAWLGYSGQKLPSSRAARLGAARNWDWHRIGSGIGTGDR